MIRIFLLCLACGCAGGFIYDFLYVIRRLFALFLKKRGVFIVTAVCDTLFFCALAALFILCGVVFGFPDVRLYMLAACMGGLVLYAKTLHITVAFFINRLYNIHTARAERALSGKE